MPTPSAADIAYQEAHLGDDRRATVIAPNVVFTIAAIVAVVLRFESRRIAKTNIKADDWWIVGGLVHKDSRSREEEANCEQILTTAYAISYSLTVKYGMGKHAILITNVKGFAIVGSC